MGQTDSLTIRYFRDTPCWDCATTVTIENDKHSVGVRDQGKGTLDPVKISVYDLLQYHLKAQKDMYVVFYYEGIPRSKTDRQLLCGIKFE